MRTLEERRLRGDLIKAYKILSGSIQTWFNLAQDKESAVRTRATTGPFNLVQPPLPNQVKTSPLSVLYHIRNSSQILLRWSRRLMNSIMHMTDTLDLEEQMLLTNNFKSDLCNWLTAVCISAF